MNHEISALYEQNREAIVRIHTQRQGKFPLGPSMRVGTGFFVDADGNLLTSTTVIEGAERCWIDWRGRKVEAKLLGLDPLTNLAVLRVVPSECVPKGEKLPFLKTVPTEDLKTGSMVIAIGYPYDLPSTPVVGFVQGFDIRCGTHMFLTSHIRAACRLQPGQGGGPVFNTRGEVIGLAVAAHLDDQCYILPINAVRRVLGDILQHGAPQYGWVGLSVTERRPPLPGSPSSQWEVFIEEVCSNTPASTAGFRQQDVLIRIGTNHVQRAADVLNTMFQRRAGDRLNLTVVRSGATQEVHLVIGQRPVDEMQLAEKSAPRPLDIVPVSVP
jgi:S1-C subfamily serine protease